jgi:3-deoxy-7-phosphoheptulonate synthase
MGIENKAPGKDVSPQDLTDKFPLAAKKNSEHQTVVEVAGVKIGTDDLVIMAGPNMVESEELIIDCAINVKKSGAHFLRGGAFKPLTFPYRSKNYMETRELGLQWLMSAKKETQLPVITEVMEERFIEEICEVADILQIGTRNMQNFPLLTAVAKTGKPIMLKRHFGCSLRDWLGAAEYILVEGNPSVILCERGIVAPHTHKDSSRFILDLQVIPAAKELTHLPILSDPSHATFWRPWVEPMALASVAAGADGLMLEVHPDPENAKVDPLQALSYESFASSMAKITKIANAMGKRI